MTLVSCPLGGAAVNWAGWVAPSRDPTMSGEEFQQ
jgi:hypothetical protein